MKGMPLIHYFVNNRRYGRTFTNGHLSTTATSLQRPFFLVDSPYIWACFNLSTTATFFCPQGGSCERFNCVQKGHLFRQKWYTAISRKVVGKSARDNAERYCGWFWVHCSSKKLKEWHERAWTYVYNCSKERNNRRFSSYSVRNRLLIISHITFRDCRVHNFSVNLSRNSCIKG